MKKNGFTLIELIAVISILAILVLLVAPNAIDIYNDGVKKSLEAEATTILDTARIYEQDYCIDPIDNTFKCPKSYTDSKFICLSNLQDSKLITKDIEYKGYSCKVIVTFDGEEDNVYLACGTQEDGYFTDETIFDGTNTKFNQELCKQ